MTTRKAAAARKPSGLDPKATYRVAMLRAVPTPAFCYRPDEEHTMTGAQLEAIAAAAGAEVGEIATLERVEG